ncbi:MAG TPA: hypothetical protein VLS91_01240 [Acidimicrobiales bacterium]|nr:hypothetical protein [Acidimicrobiales bacterium]
MARARWSVLVVALSLALASPVAAAAPTWQTAQRVILPAGSTGLSQGYLPSISCPDVGDCAATGIYVDAAGDDVGLVVSEVAGHWRAATAITAPANAASVPSVTPYWISCASAGNCAVVGSYLDNAGNTDALAVNEVNGTWRTATTITLPNDAGTSNQYALLRSVTCAAPGTCSAVGTYFDAASPVARTLGMTVAEVNGVWSAAQSVTLPAGTNATPLVSLSNLACASAGNCAATGSYLDANNITRGLLVTEVAGTWGAATTLLAPANASAYALAQVSSLDCPAAGTCSAIGTYETANGRAAGFTLDERNGRWQRAVMMRLPVAATVNPHVFFYGFAGVACASAGNCASGGQYRDANGTYQAFVINEVKGVWRDATRVALPAGASAGHNGGVVALACPSAGTCRAGAAYLDASGNYQALLLGETGNVWRTSQTVSLPGGATSVGVAGGVYALVCTAQNHCVAVGSYLASASTYMGFTVSTT